MKRPPLAPLQTPAAPPTANLNDITSYLGKVNELVRKMANLIAEHSATIRQITEGQNVVSGEVTLTANAATTTVSKDEIPPGGSAYLTPRTANASAEIGAGTIRVATTTKGAFVITHANNAQADRTFGWHVSKAG